MAFNSWTFLLLFLPVTAAVYHALVPRLRGAWLLAASCLFLGWASPFSLGLLLISALFHYLAGLALEALRPWRRAARWALALCVAMDIGALIYYKYANFLLDVLAPGHAWAQAALPIGISFYLFTGIGYLVDIFRGTIAAQRDPLRVGNFFCAFPKLISGPIVRYGEMAADLDGHRPGAEEFAAGLRLFIVGLAKKTLLAVPLGETAAAIRENAANLGPVALWAGAILYMLEIYFDFSGYSDMAVGLGRLFGLRLPRNFDLPYLSCSVSEFWRRWHMTLGAWFRDYLYFPLGGSRRGNVYCNLFIVFLATGVWHGASWTFLFWGVWNGIWVVAERFATNRERRLGREGPRAPAPLRRAGTLLAVLLGWVIFSAADVGEAFRYLAGMFCLARPAFAAFSFTYFVTPYIAFVSVLGALLALGLPQRAASLLLAGKPAWEPACRNLLEPLALLALLVLSMIWMENSAFRPFIYFQF